MPRHRRRFDERTLFAILLLEFGIVLPLLSAFSAPSMPIVRADAPISARLAAPLPEGRQAKDGELFSNQLPVAAAAELPGATPSEPVATPPLPALDLAVPGPTITNTPEPLPLVGGATAAAVQVVPTLFPTQPAESQPAPPIAEAAPGEPSGGPPPILMYHYIRYVDAASDQLGYELSIAPELFDQQMAWLHQQGYTTMRMDAAARCVRGEASCPAKAVALTFDDGYEDAFTTALPVLQRYGLTATFYIISGFVGQPGYMSWEQIGVLRDARMEIGAHTVDHPDLVNEDPSVSEYQIVQSKADLEQHLGINIVSFCYPTGLYNWTVEEQTRAAGYLSATTTRWDGDYSDIMALPRRRISGGTGVDGFAAIVLGY
jgi:peptidoglycan/xylan/chitin deacetylase (PgdA/CDA1 family)